MFIPIGMRVINKNVVYSDTVLKLDEMGENLVVTTLSDVKNKDFDECLRLIFNENKDTIFNTIQYSKNKKKVYLYTNKTVSTKAWDERCKKKFNYNNYDKSILEKIKSDLLKQDSLKVSEVSLYDVWMVYRNKEKKFDNQKEKIEVDIDRIIRDNFCGNEVLSFSYFLVDDSIKVCIYNPDFKKSDGEFFFKRNEDGDIYISESKKKACCDIGESDLLMSIGNKVSLLFELYDKNDSLYEDWKNALENSSELFNVDFIGKRIKLYEEYFDSPIEIDLWSFKEKIDIIC